MSTGQEGLGERIGGPATSEREVFLPDAREKALKMKTSALRRLEDKTSVPERPQSRRPSRREDIGEGLEDEVLCTKQRQ
jgi:hypothetical protein